MQLRILWRQKTQIPILHLFSQTHLFLHRNASPKLEKITWIFHFSLKTSAQAHVNCRLVNTLYRKKRCTGLVSKTLQAFLYFLWHGQHPGILSPFTSYLCVAQIPLDFATHFDFPSCWTGIFCPFFKLRESGIGHYSTFFIWGTWCHIWPYFLVQHFFVRSQRLEIYVCTFLATPADGMHVMEKTMRGEDCVDKVKILTVVVHGEPPLVVVDKLIKIHTWASGNLRCFLSKTFTKFMLDSFAFKLKSYESIC